MLPAEAPHAYNFAVSSKIVLWPACAGTQTRYARLLAIRPLSPPIGHIERKNSEENVCESNCGS